MARRKSTKKNATTHSVTNAATTTAKPDPTIDQATVQTTDQTTDQIPDQATAERASQDDPAPETVSVIVRRRDFLERVAENSEFRPNQIKPVMDAVLNELGKAMAAGEAMNLPPLGKLTVNRTKQTDKADIAVVRLRRKRPDEVAETPLAPPED